MEWDAGGMDVTIIIFVDLLILLAPQVISGPHQVTRPMGKPTSPPTAPVPPDKSLPISPCKGLVIPSVPSALLHLSSPTSRDAKTSNSYEGTQGVKGLEHRQHPKPSDEFPSLSSANSGTPLSHANSSFDDDVQPLPHLSDAEADALVGRMRSDLRGDERCLETDACHITSAPLPDGFLLQCLRSRSGVYDEALMVARNFLAFRRGAGWPLRLTARDVSGGPLESGAHWILPGKDKEGRGLFVFNVGRIDTRLGSLERYQQMGAYLVERLTREEEVQRTGLVMVVNMAHVPLGLYRSLISLTDAKRGVRMWQDAFPSKLKRIYVVGGSRWLLQAVRLVVAMLGKKLRKRVRVLPHQEALQEDIDAEQLPPCLGGRLEGFDWAQWVATVVAEEAGGKGGTDPVWSWGNFAEKKAK